MNLSFRRGLALRSAGRKSFERGVRTLATAGAMYPGWLSRLLTHPVKGIEHYAELFTQLRSAGGAIKVYCELCHGDRA